MTVGKALQNLGLNAVAHVRMGKYIEMDLPGTPREEADEVVRKACDLLLANPHIESYRFELVEDA